MVLSANTVHAEVHMDSVSALHHSTTILKGSISWICFATFSEFFKFLLLKLQTNVIISPTLLGTRTSVKLYLYFRSLKGCTFAQRQLHLMLGDVSSGILR
jgi:hypothetical protein